MRCSLARTSLTPATVGDFRGGVQFETRDFEPVAILAQGSRCGTRAWRVLWASAARRCALRSRDLIFTSQLLCVRRLQSPGLRQGEASFGQREQSSAHSSAAQCCFRSSPVTAIGRRIVGSVRNGLGSMGDALPSAFETGASNTPRFVYIYLSVTK